MSDTVFCTQCGHANSDPGKFCVKCGTLLRVDPQNLRTQEDEVDEEFYDDDDDDRRAPYPALRTVGTVYGILGWITLVGGLLSGLGLAIYSGANDQLLQAFILLVVSIVGGAVAALPMLAARDVVDWAIDLESNSRKTNSLLSQLLKKPTPK